MAPAIITLREPISTGKGVTTRIDATDYEIRMDGHFLLYWVEIDGGGIGTGWIPMKNVRGIFPKEFLKAEAKQ